jgi:DNA gyrase subunit B
MSEVYGDESIKQLIGAERIRKRPASMLGSSGLAGARHGFTEIYGNALDEVTSGYGDRLEVIYHKDGSISLRDYGRGVPLGWSDTNQNWNWHTIYNELYGGGKYSTNQAQLQAITDWSTFNEKDYNYLYSVGLNGLGAASTQYTSEFFEVYSYRDGVCKSRKYAKGIPLVNGEPVDMFSLTKEEIAKIPEEIEKTDEPNGTLIHWKPDSTVFDSVDIGGDWLYETCKDIAGVSGVTLHFVDEQTGKDETINAGTLQDILKQKLGDSAEDTSIFTADNFSHGSITVEGKPYTYVAKTQIAFAPSDKNIHTICFHNSVKMQSGVQYEAIANATRFFMTDIAKRRGMKLEERDYANSFAVVVSSYSNYASFRNQTKDAIDDAFIHELIYRAFLNKLQLEYNKGNTAIVDAVEKVMREAEIRIATKEQEKIIRDAGKVKREKAPTKFVSCDAYEKKQYDKAELWITEGDSAAGGVKNARNKNFQAIYPIRGKGLNVFKKSLDKTLKNKEIREIFSLIGTGFDLGIKGEKLFNIDDLKFNKIIFATDADEDGYQIRVLLFLTFYKLAPQLITDGHVFIAESPRFQLKLNTGEILYARNDAQRDEFRQKYAGRIVNESRFKGLGEMDARILRETTVHPDTRNLVPVTCDMMSESERYLIDALFGADKYKQRKNIITSILGAEVAEMMEENALMIGEIDEEDIDEGITYESV